MRALLAVSALAALAVSSRSFAQAPTFNTLVTTYKGDPGFAHPAWAAVGDFNGDGKLDSAVTDGTGTVHMLLGNGNGTFSERRIDVGLITIANADLSAMGTPNATHFAQFLPHAIDGVKGIRAIDVNGDGKLDLVLVMGVHLDFAPLGGFTVMIFTGNDASGTPQFTTSGHYFAPNFDTRSITVGDLNGDGRPEVILGNANSPIWTWLNNGDGSFIFHNSTTFNPSAGNPAVSDGVIADVNGDGKADFVVTSGQGGATDIFLGNGDGTYRAPLVIPGATSAIGVADLNKDGKLDLVLNTATGAMSVALGNGDGTFTAPVVYSTGVSGGSVNSLDVADINEDGNLDVVAGVSLGVPGKVAVFLGDGSGTLGTPYVFDSTSVALAVVAADFTGDGKPDIGSVGLWDDTYGVLTNTTPSAPPAQMFFTDSLAGPSSPNLTILTDKYGYTASGLQRIQSNNDTDRPVVTTKSSAYLTANDFTAEVSVTVANNDILYFGVGQGDSDAGYNNEPSHAFYFRVHNNFVNGGPGYYGIQAAVRSSPTSFLADHDIGQYMPGSTITLRIVRDGSAITMSVVGGGSITYNISDYPSLGLTATNTRVFFGNTSAGSVFSNLSIYKSLPDTTPPIITAPANTVVEATGPNGAIVNFTATAQDNVDGPVNVTASRPSGSTFPLGTTTVNLTATDAAGNTGTASFTVTVRDTTLPIISAPTTATAEATSAAGAVVTFVASAIDSVSGNVAVMANPSSGSTFPLGLSSVSLSATDAAGNAASGTILINVRDTIAPTLSVPANQVIEATSAAGAVVTFAATASDAVGVTSLTYSAASGSTFPIGTSIVSVTAADAAGNSSSGSFTITVRDTTAPVISSLTASSTSLWPPNHKMVPITLTAVSTDAVGVASLKIISATSNEPDNGLGDGDTTGDIEITSALTLNLRAERSGNGNGRVYTITVEAKDAAGNASIKTVTVSVPKSQGGK